MEHTDFVSVVLTCYNYENFVKDAIKSVLGQTHKHFEVIVINDGSTDRSDDEIRSFLPDSRIRYICQNNRGQAYSKNLGIALSRGKFVAFIDADDRWEETKLERQLPLFKDETIGVVYSPLRFIDYKGRVCKRRQEGFFLGPYRGKITDKLFLRNFVPFSSSIVRKRCLDDVGGFDKSIPMGIDWDLWLRMSTKYKFDYVREPLLLYRVGHSNQMSGNIALRHRCSDLIMQKFLLHNPDSVSAAVIRKSQGFTYYNRARQLTLQDRKRSTLFFLKAIRYPSFTVPSLKGLAKNGIASLDRTGFLNNFRGSVVFPGRKPVKRKSTIHIAFVIDTIRCDTEGTQRQLLETIRRLDPARYTPLLICLWHSPWMSRHNLPCDTEVLGYRGFMKINILSVIGSLRNIVRNYDIDIVQSFFEDSRIFAFLSLRFLSPTPVLLASRRDIGLDKKRPWYHHIYRLLYPIVNKYYDGVLTNSKQVAAFVIQKENVPKDKVKVIYNGIQVDHGQEQVPAELVDNSGSVRIGIVASLTPVKRVDIFMEAVAGLLRENPQTEIHGYIIGDGVLRKDLEFLCAKLSLQNHITFTGAVDNVPAYLKHLDIGVNCSEREGLSNAVLEYMAYGLPVIATDVGGNTELIDENRGNLVEVGNTEQMIRSLYHLINDKDLRITLGGNSREYVMQNFSWEKSMAELDSYYESFMEKRNRGARYVWQYPQSQQ